MTELRDSKTLQNTGKKNKNTIENTNEEKEHLKIDRNARGV